jgi:isopentenyl diphosphate isomerase/L-lactate dehydrogenase-like FMN-dependent dehydrogenase
MNFPDMGDAFSEWGDTQTVRVVTKTMQDHDVVEVKNQIEIDMLLAPMRAQQVERKPEGQRAWRWWTGYSDHRLAIDDHVIDDEGTVFNVDAVNNYKIAGFYSYELHEAFK